MIWRDVRHFSKFWNFSTLFVWNTVFEHENVLFVSALPFCSTDIQKVPIKYHHFVATYVVLPVIVHKQYSSINFRFYLLLNLSVHTCMASFFVTWFNVQRNKQCVHCISHNQISYQVLLSLLVTSQHYNRDKLTKTLYCGSRKI